MLRLVVLVAIIDNGVMFQGAVPEKFLRCSCTYDNLQSFQFGIKCNRSVIEVSGASEVSCSSERKHYAPRDYVSLSWTEAEGFSSLYRVFRTSRSWKDAKLACARDGASLAVAETHGESRALLELLRKSRRTDAFVGLRRSNSNAPFRTNQGHRADFDYKAWASGQPSTRRGFNCALLHDDTVEGGLVASNCSKLNPFICEWKLEIHVPKNYLYVPGMGFYSVGTQITTFEKASKLCERDGGHIIVLDDEEEAALIMIAFDLYPGETRVYVGLQMKQDQFYTVLGEAASTLQFQNWEQKTENDDCVVLTVTGTLKTVNCKKLLPFVCEISQYY